MNDPRPSLGRRAAALLLITSATSLGVATLPGCDKPPEPTAKARAEQTAAGLMNTATPVKTADPAKSVTPVGSEPRGLSAEDTAMRMPAPARLVAVGDLHGDLEATRKTLRLAGAIDGKDHWVGGPLVLVQTGDQLDRGDGERAILEMLERLEGEAKAAGGAVVVLNGNHEVMNVDLDFRYVTEGGFKDFAGVPGARLDDPRVTALPEAARARGAAFVPGGPWAKRLARRSTIAIIGDTVFVHGGVLPKHVQYGLSRMNREVSAWMAGEAPAAPAIVKSEDGPIWTRRYSAAPDRGDCAVLEEALAAMGAKRMVVGHTVQREGITSACNEKVWRIDVGLSHTYGGKPAALEVRGDAVRALTEAAPAPEASGASSAGASPAHRGEDSKR